MPDAARPIGAASAVRALTGLVLTGYGALVLAGVLAHDAPLAGILGLACGALLLIPGLPRIEMRQGRLLAAVGAAGVACVLGYDLITHSGLSTPEWALLLYAVGLVAAAPFLACRIGSTDVATLVAWSLPVLLGPLALFALNGLLSTESSGAAAAPLVRSLLVLPVAAGLRLFGTPVEVVDTTLLLATDRGVLSLSVGLVCAGLYPAVLFLGLAGLHGWKHPGSRRKLALLVAAGLVGLWLVNLARLVLLAKVGQEWGAAALQAAHANLGWILFVLYMVLFWWLVFRFAPPVPAPGPAA